MSTATVASVRKYGSLFAILVFILGFSVLPAFSATNWTVVGWNNLGMHCMDADFSVFSILPPYNTVNARSSTRVVCW